MSTFSQHQSQMKAIDRGAYLGRLVWYTVSEVSVSHDDLKAALVVSDLDAFAPRSPSNVDVFRRACSAAQRKKVVTVDAYGNSETSNYLLRDLPADEHRVHKLLVRERVDAANLTYKTDLCAIDFVRANDRIEIDCSNTTDGEALAIAETIRQGYEAGKGMIGSYGIRELIRRVLVSQNATNVRGGGGGVYFVSEERGTMVDNLERLADLLPGAVTVHSLPLLDDKKQRTMLRRAFESESVEEIERMIAEISELDTSGKKVTADRVSGYFDQMAAFQARIAEYADLLEEGMTAAEVQLEIFQFQVMELTAKVEED